MATEDLSASLELVLDLHCDIGEGPIWDGDSSTLTFIDQTPGRIYRFDPATGSLSNFEIGRDIGAAIPRVGGGFVLTSSDGLLQVREDGGPVSLLLPIDADNGDTRLNDAKCDREGRLWTGTFSRTFKRGTSALYCVHDDLTVTTALRDVSISNGMAWSPDGTRMYFADTATRGVDTFDYDLATGRLSNRRQFVAIERSEGVPDGMTIDSQGYLWVALYLGGTVRRYAPDGTCVGVVKLPVIGTTSCGFGGIGLRDLYITTAMHVATKIQRPPGLRAGALFKCRPGARGLPEPKFPH